MCFGHILKSERHEAGQNHQIRRRSKTKQRGKPRMRERDKIQARAACIRPSECPSLRDGDPLLLTICIPITGQERGPDQGESI